MSTDRDRAGAVQAFEFCYELAWKMMKRVLGTKGIEVNSPKETFCQAARENLIDDPEMWFDFLEKRNLGSHIYERANLIEIVNTFDSFSEELDKLLQRLGATP